MLAILRRIAKVVAANIGAVPAVVFARPNVAGETCGCYDVVGHSYLRACVTNYAPNHVNVVLIE